MVRLLIIVFLNMEYTYNKREELEIGVNTMITLERKLVFVKGMIFNF